LAEAKGLVMRAAVQMHLLDLQHRQRVHPHLLRQQDHLPLLRLRQRPLVVVLLVVVQRAQMLVRQSGG